MDKIISLFKEEKMENKKIPQDMDFMKLEGISIEARQKLTKIKPLSLGQASRISGVSPADIAILMVYVKKYKGEKV